jgi:hypothetical protein
LLFGVHVRVELALRVELAVSPVVNRRAVIVVVVRESVVLDKVSYGFTVAFIILGFVFVIHFSFYVEESIATVATALMAASLLDVLFLLVIIVVLLFLFVFLALVVILLLLLLFLVVVVVVVIVAASALALGGRLIAAGTAGTGALLCRTTRLFVRHVGRRRIEVVLVGLVVVSRRHFGVWLLTVWLLAVWLLAN